MMIRRHAPSRFPFLTVAAVLFIAAANGCGGSDDDTTDSTRPPAEIPVAAATPPETTDGQMSPADLFDVEDGFQLLSLDDFEQFQAEADTWKQDGEILVCSGKPRGYIYTKQPYGNFTMRLDYRFPRPDDLQDDATFAGNTGFLIYTADEHKLWPVSLEVQGKYPEMGTIKPNGGAADVELQDDEQARQSARKPVGEWNTIEIISKDGAITAILNGVKVCECQPKDLREGTIGIQSEGFEVHFRNVRIQKM